MFESEKICAKATKTTALKTKKSPTKTVKLPNRKEMVNKTYTTPTNGKRRNEIFNRVHMGPTLHQVQFNNAIYTCKMQKVSVSS